MKKENNIIELTKEYNLGNQENKFPIITPTVTKIIKRKKNKNTIQSKMNKTNLVTEYNKYPMNINNMRRNLPKIMTSYTPIEKRNKNGYNYKHKNNKGNKVFNLSRNFDMSSLSKYNSENENFILKKNNKNDYIENDNFNDISLSKNLTPISRNEINNEYNYENSNFMTHNNISPINKDINNNKIKIEINKKNIMTKIKRPSKISLNLNKKNLKYKIPMDMINNFNNQRRNKKSNENNRKLNLKQKNNRYNNIRDNMSLTPNAQRNNNTVLYNNYNNIRNNKKKDLNIESTFITFNNLVSQAKELGHILIDNKDLLKTENFECLENEDNGDLLEINNINMKQKINKLNQEIQNEHKGVEELQKINSELNNKINLFNENAKQYEKKVDELITVINQVKNSNNNTNNNSDNISNGISNNNNMIKEDSNNNFSIEKKPKKKKYKFGFVELIFMKDDKFQVIQKKKKSQYKITENKNFLIKNKEPKLVFINLNKNKNNKIKPKATNEDYLDAASQMANHIIIESLISLKNEELFNSYIYINIIFYLCKYLL